MLNHSLIGIDSFWEAGRCRNQAGEGFLYGRGATDTDFEFGEAPGFANQDKAARTARQALQSEQGRQGHRLQPPRWVALTPFHGVNCFTPRTE